MSIWDFKTNKKHGAKESAPKLSSLTGEWVIEKDVPIPEIGNGKRRTGLTACLRAMEVGDSVLVGMNDGSPYSRVSAYQSLNDARFTTRTVEGGLRIWRVE